MCTELFLFEMGSKAAESDLEDVEAEEDPHERMNRTVGDQFFDLVLDCYFNVVDRSTKEMRRNVQGMDDQMAQDLRMRWQEAVVKKIKVQRDRAMRSRADQPFRRYEAFVAKSSIPFPMIPGASLMSLAYKTRPDLPEARGPTNPRGRFNTMLAEMEKTNDPPPPSSPSHASSDDERMQQISLPLGKNGVLGNVFDVPQPSMEELEKLPAKKIQNSEEAEQLRAELDQRTSVPFLQDGTPFLPPNPLLGGKKGKSGWDLLEDPAPVPPPPPALGANVPKNDLATDDPRGSESRLKEHVPPAI